MNIGKIIRDIRTKNNMSQEEFGKLFFVTRQTVSNWENEKNFPDLKTIVDISDKFDISLDKLLKEDKEMVESITTKVRVAEKWNKYRRVVAMVSGAVIAVTAVTGGIYSGVWLNKKNKVESCFNTAVTELGFRESENRVYERNDSTGIKYVLPHQEMPSLFDFSLDFHAKYVYGIFEEKGNDFTLINIENESYSLEVNDENDEYFYSSIDENGMILNEERLTVEQVKLIKDNSETIKTALSETMRICDKVYL